MTLVADVCAPSPLRSLLLPRDATRALRVPVDPIDRHPIARSRREDRLCLDAPPLSATGCATPNEGSFRDASRVARRIVVSRVARCIVVSRVARRIVPSAIAVWRSSSAGVSASVGCKRGKRLREGTPATHEQAARRRRVPRNQRVQREEARELFEREASAGGARVKIRVRTRARGCFERRAPASFAVIEVDPAI